MQGVIAPKSAKERIIFTTLGVLLMATTMATFNKRLVFGSFSMELFKQVAVAFCWAAPVAFLLQFFVVQKFAGKQTAKYKTNNQILYYCIRTGFTVLIMCPSMSFYNNLVNMFRLHWSFGTFLENWISKMPINWIYAFCVQVWLLGPINRFLFGIICPRGKNTDQE